MSPGAFRVWTLGLQSPLHSADLVLGCGRTHFAEGAKVNAVLTVSSDCSRPNTNTLFLSVC